MLGKLWQVMNMYIGTRAHLRSRFHLGLYVILEPKAEHGDQTEMAYPLKLGERRVSFWLQCFGPQDIPVSLASAFKASLLKGCPNCIVGNASILHSH